MTRQLVVTVPAVDAELASDALWGLGVVAVEERVDVDGETELWTSLGDEATAADVRLPQPWPWRFVEVDDAVAETWRQFAQPVWVEADLVVCPAWVPFDEPAGVVVLRIEPGATFGMGDHPTTMLSMRALQAGWCTWAARCSMSGAVRASWPSGRACSAPRGRSASTSPRRPCRSPPPMRWPMVSHRESG
ncbi:MAG: 50S ribosomal protein L11 methyltransferase [Acidimicrobiaceae bacterium]|nr:50S ribosomal protein L11 methyltransferase [Acidimicrobiaceae bacterium]